MNPKSEMNAYQQGYGQGCADAEEKYENEIDELRKALALVQEEKDDLLKELKGVIKQYE